MEKYKGVEKLVKVFSELKLKKAKLVIAGKSRGAIISLDKNIMIVNEFIRDEEVQNYFNACDVCVYPFVKITNSSSLMLSFGFGKVCIVPRLRTILDLPKEMRCFDY